MLHANVVYYLRNTPEHLPHSWLDGLEALCLMSARQRNPQLPFWSVFFRNCLLPVIIHSVRIYDPLHLPTLGLLLANSSRACKTHISPYSPWKSYP